MIASLESACLHKSKGRPGIDRGTVEIQDATLYFGYGKVEGIEDDLPSEILEGNLRVASSVFPNMITLPCQSSDEPVSLTWYLDPDHRKLVISGTSLRVVLQGAPSSATEWP